MPRTKKTERAPLPKRFDELVALMASGRLSKDQAAYLETLVQLVAAYDAREYVIEVEELEAIATLRHLMDQADMNGSDLARLLGLHPSMGSKLLDGDRSLTLDHVRRPATHFGVRPDAFVA